MILIDSVYVHNSGGLVLLKYLVSTLIKEDEDFFFLMDKRSEFYFKTLNLKNSKYIKNSHFERYLFYKENFCKFNKVFCFGNIPPPVRLNIPSVVYFHNATLLNLNKNMSLKETLFGLLKQTVLFYLKRNAKIWIVQNKLIKDNLCKKYIIASNRVKVFPFFLTMPAQKKKNYNENSFVYISTYYPHKNHEKLIDAFCKVYDRLKKGTLTLTVPYSNIEICSIIDSAFKKGYPIYNIGFVSRDKLAEIYLNTEYLIFPSLTESFGLGIVEGIECGCKVLASNLPYVFEVCEPSLVFDPNNVESISESIEHAIKNKFLKDSKILINNNIDELVKYIISNEHSLNF